MGKMEIVKIALQFLEPNTGQVPGLPPNPRQWTKAEVQNIAKSLKETPELFEARPLLVFPIIGGKFVILGGNLRHEGAKRNKMKEVPCIVFPEDTPPAKLKEIVIKDNGAFGSWDYDELANQWDDLPLPEWGVPAWDNEIRQEPAPPAQEDDFDEKEDGILVRCKPGDVWALGDHRLMCGDSTDLETVKKLMGGALADMVFTDPPYGTTQLEWDKEPDLPAMFNCLENSCKKEAPILITGTQPFVTDLINARRKMFRYEIIWVKKQPTGFFDANKRPMRIHEIICVFYSRQPTYNPQKNVKMDAHGIGRKRGNSDYMKTNGGHVGKVGREKAETYTYTEDGTRYPTDVIEFSNWNGALFGNTEKAVVHPTQKPVDLVTYLISTYSNEGDLVLDAFGGSGTTIIAAEQTGRKCYMMELDPHYCDVIIARWEKLTGKTARKVTKGQN